jgi:CRP-like cAMP-binding protein
VFGMPGNRLQYLTQNDWVIIGAKASRHAFKLGEEIIREGESGEAIFIIRRGEATVELAGTGARAIVAHLGPEDICGEMAFLEPWSRRRSESKSIPCHRANYALSLKPSRVWLPVFSCRSL